MGNINYQFFFTVLVSEVYLTDPNDSSIAKECHTLLDEIADRVELELYLDSLKDFKY